MADAKLMLTVDPGWSTGWSEWVVTPTRISLVRQGTIEGGVDGWNAFRIGPSRYNIVVCEDFIVDPSYVGRAWSSEIIGAIKTERALLGGRSPSGSVILQPRSDKTTLFTQKHLGDKGETERFAWLRERGFGGAGHELDAITHALVYLKRQRNKAALKEYWDI